MTKNDNVHPNAPAGGGGPGAFRSALPMGADPGQDKWMHPGPLGDTLGCEVSNFCGPVGE